MLVSQWYLPNKAMKLLPKQALEVFEANDCEVDDIFKARQFILELTQRLVYIVVVEFGVSFKNKWSI